jgi:beta-glucanase (GH16 family)
MSAVLAMSALAFAAPGATLGTRQEALSAPAPSGPTCGDTILKADGVPWKCTFDDEFNGTSLNTTKWTVQQTPTSGYATGPLGYHACYIDRPENVSVSGGYLALTARKEASTFNCGAFFKTQYTAGSVSGFGKFSQAYGRFEVRALVPQAAVPGLQESFWLWPVNSTKYGAQPASGEIDIAELYSQYPTLAMPYIHYKPGVFDPNLTSYKCTIDITKFHTYTLEWTPSSLTVIYDGNTCLVDNWKPAAPLVAPQPFDQPFFLALTQALGIATNSFDPATTPLPATTLVDYARIWK